MHRPSHNRRVVNLNKVQWCKFFYEQQDGIRSNTLPMYKSVHGLRIFESAPALWHVDYQNETVLARATRLNLLDIWEPVCIVQLTANHQLHYVGKKALAIWKAWQSKIYGTKN